MNKLNDIYMAAARIAIKKLGVKADNLGDQIQMTNRMATLIMEQDIMYESLAEARAAAAKTSEEKDDA